MNNFEFIKSYNVAEAIKTVTAGNKNVFIAGGTNLIDLWKYDLVHPEMLIDINPVDTLHIIQELPNGGVRLGALATNADTAWHPLVEARYPLLSKAILAGASGQIRNMATNGGNLLQRTRCYYFYDADVPCNKRVPGSGCPAINGYNRIHAILGTSENCIAVFPSDMSVALAALDATINFSSVDNSYTMPFSEFHRLPGDNPELDNNLPNGNLITSIDLPAKGFHKNYSYLKLRDRASYSFALVSVATAFELEGDSITEARIALGGVAQKPWRNPEAEDFLRGKAPTDDNFSIVAEMILKDAVGYKHNAFKIPLAKQAIIRNCRMALDPSSQRPGAKPSA